MDNYAPIRSLTFPTVAPRLGIDLKRFKVAGNGEWAGYCPIHQSKTNNQCFRYALDGKFHCFSCDAKGRGALDLAKAVRQLGFKQAVELLEPLVGKDIQPDTKKQPEEAVVLADGELNPLEKDTWRKFAVPCPWLEQRIPDAAVREQYGVFCYNNPARKSLYSGRVMIPIRDVSGVLYGYLGRSILAGLPQHPEDANTPKYLFPKSLPRNRFLFGAHELSQTHTLPVKVLYIVESPFCAMKFASMGLPAVSPFGWSVSPEQLQIMQSLARGVVYLPDRNKCDSVQEVVQQLAQRLWVRMPPLPAGIDDPEALSLEQIRSL